MAIGEEVATSPRETWSAGTAFTLPRPGSKIPKLDFLRAVSAAIVVLYHTGNTIVPAGFGVLVFFVISGFLITHLLIRESESTGTVSLRGFYVRRSLRIFPPFYVYWIIAIAALTVRHARIIWPQAICSLFYVNNYYQGLHGYPSSLFSHTWSLGVEEQFYLLWPFAFVSLRKRLDILTRVLLVLIPALWIYRTCLYFAGVSDPYLYTSFETRVDAILVGCLFALLLHLGAVPRLIAEVRRLRYLPITIAAIAASVAADNNIGFGYRYVVGSAIDPILVMLLILQLIAYRHAAWMDSGAVSYLGKISYSTYLYQQLVIPVVMGTLPGIPHSVAVVLCLVCVWLVAAVSCELVEKPFLRLKDRFHSSSRAIHAL